MSRRSFPHLFDGYGIEIEYMIVDQERLDVLPIADEILRTVAGRYMNEVQVGPLAWSNELVLHVVEIKTDGPVVSLAGLASLFHEHVQRINRLLEPRGGRLMPSAMHPWMDPESQTRLWPHGSRRIYEAYDRIFGCRGHGWANVQSVHLNLGFKGDEEFGRLHAAIRLLLPLLPALAASSPVKEGRITGLADTRLDFYWSNQGRVPSIAGDIIPEPVYTRAAYKQEILHRTYRDIAPYDPKNILRHEWLNSRGAIARFDRSAIEIRLLDVQECPRADLAIASAIVAVLKALVAERWCSWEEQRAWEVKPLSLLLRRTIQSAAETMIEDHRFLRTFGLPAARATAGEVWRHLIEQTMPAGASIDPDLRAALNLILDRGPLARRILQALKKDQSQEQLRAVYQDLCTCLAEGRLFLGELS